MSVCDEDEIATLAATLKCSPRQIRPCFADAFLGPPTRLAGRAYLTTHTFRFVAFELLTILPVRQTAAAALRLWAKQRRINATDVAGLLRWTERNAWRRKGCGKQSAARNFCCGKEYCSYFKSRGWTKAPRASEVANADLEAFGLRGWPMVLSAAEHKMYVALYGFEKQHGLKPGTPLLFSARQGRLLAGMRETRQRQALEALQDHGLVQVTSWGAPRTAGMKVQTRTVKRVVPIPTMR